MGTEPMLKIGTKGDFLLRLQIGETLTLLEGASTGFLGYRIDDDESDDGVFVAWSFNDGHFYLNTDRLGLYPVYYLASDHEFIISNSVELITRIHALEIDAEAVSIFLRLGFFLGSDTAFKSLFRPTGKLTVSANSSGFDIKVCKPDASNVSHVHTPEQYQALMLQSLSSVKGLEQPLYMPLTGGKDSRHIFLSLMQLTMKPDTCYTVSVLAPHYNDDVVIARRLAGSFEVPHQTLAADKHLIQSEYAKNRLTNFETRDHSWAAPALDFLNEAPSGIVLDGFGGDVLSQSSIVTPEMHQMYRNSDWSNLIQTIAKDNTYFNSWINKAHHHFIVDEALLKDRLIAELEQYKGETNPMAQFYFWNRSRRSIAISSIRYLSGQSTVFMPFMQRDLYDFLRGLPVELYFSRNFHKEAISRLENSTISSPYSLKELPGESLKLGAIISNYCGLFLEMLRSEPLELKKGAFAMTRLLFSKNRSIEIVQFYYFYRRILYLNQVIKVANQ
ncbi:MAG: hypothetical protein JJU30_12850 [Alkalimonas sp.]|nr:hypothetical protein [Alkalimonas sp.]